jgi:hypothetical protein
MFLKVKCRPRFFLAEFLDMAEVYTFEWHRKEQLIIQFAGQ